MPGGTPAFEPHNKDFKPEIQGLRAIAILAVVLYHVHAPGFAGGFAGVDVFFVISGFLICGALMRELRDTGQVSVLRFWARRARRLLPNALLMIGTVILAAQWLIPAYRRSSLYWDAFTASINVANYHFAAAAVDYFHRDSPDSPLLHFWSLNIEEQFYAVWPLILWLLGLSLSRRAYRVVPVVLIAIALGSFGYSLWLLTYDQPLAYFHGASRAWELAAGGLLVLVQPHLLRGPRWIASILGGIGLIGVLGAICWYGDAMTYPGYAALLPTLGAAMVIAATQAGAGPVALSRLLSVPPLQWFGKLSYSLYLWHWPVLMFAAILFPEVSFAPVLGVAMSVLLAWVTFNWVEEPVHRGRLLAFGPANTLAIALASVGAISIASLALANNLNVSGSRATAADLSTTERLRHAASEAGTNDTQHCHLDPKETAQPPCIFGAIHSANRAVLFGDSHASQWFAPLDLAAKTAGWRLDAWTKSSCPSVEMPMYFVPKKVDFTECSVWRADVLNKLTGPDKPDLVFLSNLVDYTGWVRDPSGGAELSREAVRARWSLGFASVLRRLMDAGLQVVVIRDTPQAYRDFADCLAAHGGSACSRPRAAAVSEPSPDVEVALTFDGVMVVDLTDRICNQTLCPVERDGLIVYRDRHHLTPSFAATLADGFERAFKRR